MEKVISFLFVIFLFISPMLLPILGIIGIDKSITILIILATIYSIVYILINLKKVINFVIFFIITFLSIKSYETFNPIITTLIYIPLFDFICNIIDIIIIRFSNRTKD